MSGQTIKLIEDLPKQLDKTTLASSGSQLPKSASLGVFGIPGLCAHLALTKGQHPMSSQINWGVSEYFFMMCQNFTIWAFWKTYEQKRLYSKIK